MVSAMGLRFHVRFGSTRSDTSRPTIESRQREAKFRCANMEFAADEAMLPAELTVRRLLHRPATHPLGENRIVNAVPAALRAASDDVDGLQRAQRLRYDSGRDTFVSRANA